MTDKSALPPASEPFPGSRTPGWNDPPTLQYNPLNMNAAVARPRISLNKRVAFPLQGTANATVGAKPMAIVPPAANTSQAMLPPPATATLNTHSQQQEHTVGSVLAMPANALEQSMHSLQAQLCQVKESLNVHRDDVQKRLNIMAELWKNGSLSAALQEKIYRFSKAISDNQYKEAMDLYTYLMTNHSTECAQWGIALRHIALTIETNNVPTASSSNSATAIPTVFVPTFESASAQIETANSCSKVQHI